MRSPNQSVYSVGQVNSYIKNMFAQDFMLSRIYVRGEVSNCKYHTSGHLYFSLKDASGTIACVMFAGQRRGLAFRMKDGDKVIVGGNGMENTSCTPERSAWKEQGFSTSVSWL